jgi:hypothetical protein
MPGAGSGQQRLDKDEKAAQGQKNSQFGLSSVTTNKKFV